MTSDTPTTPIYLDQRQLAEILGVSTRCLEKWRLEGRGPKFYRVSRTLVRYKLSDVNAFMEKASVSPVATSAA
jgi:hypothetical protein